MAMPPTLKTWLFAFHQFVPALPAHLLFLVPCLHCCLFLIRSIKWPVTWAFWEAILEGLQGGEASFLLSYHLFSLTCPSLAHLLLGGGQDMHICHGRDGEENRLTCPPSKGHAGLPLNLLCSEEEEASLSPSAISHLQACLCVSACLALLCHPPCLPACNSGREGGREGLHCTAHGTAGSLPMSRQGITLPF